MSYQNMNNLVKGKEYTYAGYTEIGLSYHMHIRIIDIRLVHTQFYGESHKVTYKNLKNHKTAEIMLYPKKQFILWEGIVDPVTNFIVHTFIKEDSQGAVTYMKRWRHNDPRYMHRALASIGLEPVVSNFQNLLDTESKLFDACMVIS